jgi:hypothetical protein
MMAALVATLISLVVSSMSRNVKMLKKIWVGLSLVTSHTCWAADIYAPETNQLSISSVEVAGSTYNNVVVTVGTVIRVDGGIPNGSTDVYNSSKNLLSIPSVIVNGTTYTNVLITIDQVISVGPKSPLTIYKSSYENAKQIQLDPNQLATIGRIYTGTAFVIGDFERTGNKDLIVHTQVYDSSKSTPITAPKGLIKYYKIQSNGSYKEDSTKIINPTGCLHPRKALVADFNSDGKPDVFFACHGYDAPPFPGETNKIVLSQKDGTWSVSDASSDIAFWHSATAFDVDGDGNIDVMAVNGNNIFTFINDGSGHFKKENFSRFQGLETAPYYSIDAINLNDDSYPEIVIGGHEFEGAKTLILFGKAGITYNTADSTTIPALSDQGIVLDFFSTGSISDQTLWILRTNQSPFYNDKSLQRFNLKSKYSSTSFVKKATPWAYWLFKFENNLEAYNPYEIISTPIN